MQDNHRIESLKHISLFTSLSTDELRQIRGRISMKSFKKNEVILHEEDTSEYMYIIVAGEAKVLQTTEEGREIMITMHQAGDFFGELSLIDGKTAPAAVLATKDSVTAIISKDNFYQMLYHQNKVLKNLLQILCKRLRDNMKKIQLLNFNNAAQRIKMLLLLMSESYGEKTDKGIVLNIRLIHQDIADMTGLTRETVTRILDKWKRNGEISFLKNKHILLRPEFESIQF